MVTDNQKNDNTPLPDLSRKNVVQHLDGVSLNCGIEGIKINQNGTQRNHLRFGTEKTILEPWNPEPFGPNSRQMGLRPGARRTGYSQRNEVPTLGGRVTSGPPAPLLFGAIIVSD